MTAVDQRTKVTTRHEYVVKDPAPYGEVQEAIMFAKRDAQAAGIDTSYDDAMHVTHDDDHIIVYWEEAVKL